jgi:hypothetical protein
MNECDNEEMKECPYCNEFETMRYEVDDACEYIEIFDSVDTERTFIYDMYLKQFYKNE